MSVLINQSFEAFSKAAVWHKDQFYGVHPYTYHLLQVAAMAEKMGGGDTERAVSYLHDILEDTDIPVIELLTSFSADVVEAVIVLTKPKSELVGAYAEYIAKVRKNPLALLVKKADTLCNLTNSVIEGNTKRVLKYTNQLKLLSQ